MLNLTALIAYKDREFNLSCCLASINRCDPRPQVVVVDFGSVTPIEKYLEQYAAWLRVIRVNNETALFHKARALNIGLKKIKTGFFCATDCDQLFQPNFFGVVYKSVIAGKTCVLCRTHFLRNLPKNRSSTYIAKNYFGLLKRAKKSGRKVRGDGCCTGLPTQWAMHVRGWDERYIGYGAEDSDLIIRATRSGFTSCSINNHTSMIHLPHVKQSIYYSNKYLLENRKRYGVQKKLLQRSKGGNIVVNMKNNWGKL